LQGLQDFSQHRTEITGMADTRTARCGCGGLTVTARGEPAQIYACSCLKCQRQSGGAFTYSAIFPEDALSIAGERRAWRHRGDSSRWTETEFCPTCGVNVFFRTEAWPGLIGVYVGCFADPEFPQPAMLFWAVRRHRWLTLPDGIAVMQTQPD
jgi:hypothetical protein